jgi:hypothetical protein
MAVLFMDGFDAGDYNLKNNFLQGAPSSSTLNRFGVGRSLQLNGAGVTTGVMKKLIPASSTIFAGFAFYVSAPRSEDILSFYSDTGTVSHVTLSTNVDQSFSVKRGGTVVASSPALTFSANTWLCIEIKVTVDDVSGVIEVKQSGQTVISFSGDTRNGGTSANIDAFAMIFSGLTYHLWFDDLYVLNSTGSAPYNTYLGDVRVHTSSPTAAGNSTQFTPSTGANYAAVDELPYSATDYVSAVPSGTKDTYQMADLTVTPANIFGIQTNLIAKKTDAGAASIRPIVRTGATDYAGTSAVVLSGDKTFSEVRELNPNTSAAWTAAGINGLELGMEVM